jgi:hypothetical protein
LPCYLLWMYVKDLVLGAKVDLNTCTNYITCIIEIDGDLCYSKCGSGGSVYTVLLDKSAMASGFTVTACVSCDRTVYIFVSGLFLYLD